MVEPVRHSSLTISSMIGAGKFAHVYSGVLSSVPAGVKKQIHSINDDRDAALVARYVRTEAAVMRECGMHKNVLTLRGWLPHEVSGAIWLVTDLGASDLLSLLVSDVPLQAVFRVRAALEVVRGLAHVHARGWMHRDLKGRALSRPPTGLHLPHR
mmetsp:Transcript_12729/g.37874  ORF Transcript_12729/g.37874 Transcript_12729/m.37874 type:complete len:155 (-) Transcript_12729:1505-1969(-)